jgi:hypothetical protein
VFALLDKENDGEVSNPGVAVAAAFANADDAALASDGASFNV